MKKFLCLFVSTVFCLAATAARAEDKSIIIETLPVSWGLYGANIGFEFGMGQNSIIADYHHFGNEAIYTKWLDEDGLGFNGHSGSIGFVYYSGYEEKGNQGFYVGAKASFAQLNAEYYEFDDYENLYYLGETTITGFGAYFLLGWRWTFETVSLRLGFNLGGIMAMKTESSSFYDPIEGEIDTMAKSDTELITKVWMNLPTSGLEFAVGVAF